MEPTRPNESTAGSQAGRDVVLGPQRCNPDVKPARKYVHISYLWNELGVVLWQRCRARVLGQDSRLDVGLVRQNLQQ